MFEQLLTLHIVPLGCIFLSRLARETLSKFLDLMPGNMKMSLVVEVSDFGLDQSIERPSTATP